MIIMACALLTFVIALTKHVMKTTQQRRERFEGTQPAVVWKEGVVGELESADALYWHSAETDRQTEACIQSITLFFFFSSE